MIGLFNYQAPTTATNMPSRAPSGQPANAQGAEFSKSGSRSKAGAGAVLAESLLERLSPREGRKPKPPAGGTGGGRPDVTTLALGEEEGGHRPPVATKPPVKCPPDATTLAIGEEDGGNPPPSGPPHVTTMAYPEEDGGSLPPVEPWPPRCPPVVTTQAIGEEDGGIGGIKPPVIRPPEITTMAVGEEDGGWPAV